MATLLAKQSVQSCKPAVICSAQQKAAAPARTHSKKTSIHRTLQLGTVSRTSKRNVARRVGFQTVRAASAASVTADGGDEDIPELVVFPRVKERDPYVCLGVSREATYEEIQDARNYLVKTHQRHIDGVEAIDAAFDKVVAEKLRQRKKDGKINLKKEKPAGSPSRFQEWMLNNTEQNVPQKLILQRAALYCIFAAWSVVQAAQSGPAFQVLVAFVTTIYLMTTKRGGKAAVGGATLLSFVALFGGWLIGTILPVYIPIFPPSLSPECVCSLFAFASLFVVATFFK